MVYEREIETIRERHKACQQIGYVETAERLRQSLQYADWSEGASAMAAVRDRATLLSALLTERERVAALEAALAPFANFLDEYEADREPLLDSETLTISTAVHVFRTARSVLESGHE
jgi:hypothetical protein